MELLILFVLTGWGFGRYAAHETIGARHKTVPLRLKERGARRAQAHQRKMTKWKRRGGRLTIAEAISARVADRIANPRGGPARQAMAEWWGDSWGYATERRRARHERASRGELRRQKAARAATGWARVRWQEHRRQRQAANGPNTTAGPASGPGTAAGPASGPDTTAGSANGPGPASGPGTAAGPANGPETATAAAANPNPPPEAPDPGLIRDLFAKFERKLRWHWAEFTPNGTRRRQRRADYDARYGTCSEHGTHPAGECPDEEEHAGQRHSNGAGQRATTTEPGPAAAAQNPDPGSTPGPSRRWADAEARVVSDSAGDVIDAEIVDDPPDQASGAQPPEEHHHQHHTDGPLASVHPIRKELPAMTSSSISTHNVSSGETLDPTQGRAFVSDVGSLAQDLASQIELSAATLQDKGVAGELVDDLHQMHEAAQILAHRASSAAEHFSRHMATQDQVLSDPGTAGTVEGGYLSGAHR